MRFRVFTQVEVDTNWAQHPTIATLTIEDTCIRTLLKIGYLPRNPVADFIYCDLRPSSSSTWISDTDPLSDKIDLCELQDSEHKRPFASIEWADQIYLSAHTSRQFQDTF